MKRLMRTKHVMGGRHLSTLTVAALAGCLLALVFAGGASPAFPGMNGKIVFASDHGGALDESRWSARADL